MIEGVREAEREDHGQMVGIAVLRVQEVADFNVALRCARLRQPLTS